LGVHRTLHGAWRRVILLENVRTVMTTAAFARDDAAMANAMAMGVG